MEQVQDRRKGFAGILSRSGTSASSWSQSAASSSTTDAVAQADKDPLGLTTVSISPPPTAPEVDIIFVHGLGGGSRKTWSFSPHPSHFWPGVWLPEDPDFQHARIHTFGYRADWVERQQSSWSILTFARTLVGSIKDHPDIRRDNTRIILVGHSLGGCVCKKAYILARYDPTCQALARRVHSIFFLGTPHRGSNLAIALENMMTVAWGKKPFVSDLVPNSTALSEMNEVFRHFAPDLRLCSFYETLPVRTKLTNRIVVEKESATLGYPGEQILGMDADHRHVCKFETPSDPNYKILRNALVTSIDMARAASREFGGAPSLDGLALSPRTHERPPADEMLRLRSLLGVSPDVEDDLLTLQLLKEPGSCVWFTERPCFTEWKSGSAPNILWVTGRPAAGKSILSSHVIDQLRAPTAACSYFFFKHGVAGKSSLSDCYKSIALQMAIHDSLVRQSLLKMEADDAAWDKTDDMSVWRRLFSRCILKLPVLHRHVWVMDGLEECSDFNALFTKRVISTLPPELRLFVASRNLEEVERGLASLGPRVFVHALSDDDTAGDMRLFLQTKLRELGRLGSNEECDSMCEKILAKSSGSFLWVRLVLQEFENSWTEEEMEEVLRQVPVGLQEMYLRILRHIESSPSKAQLARAILSWALLGSRPLTVNELCAAVRLDTNRTLQQGNKAIPNLCGQLVFVDQTDRVQVIHETAKRFLTSGELQSNLAVDKTQGHTRLGSLILKYLRGDALKQRQARPNQLAFKTKAFGKSAVAAALPDLSFLDYASSHFADHLIRATSRDNRLSDDLCAFLQSRNLLSWIEHLAKNNNLGVINKTAMNMRDYLGRRMKYVPPTDPTVHLLDSWITDLIRVPAKFGTQLLLSPSAIHCLIPPLCPPDTIISKSFARDPKAPPLHVKGIPPGTWDDCLARFDFQGGETVAVAHGSRLFAAGVSTGEISLFERSSVQKIKELKHPESAGILEFGPEDQHLASAGRAHVVVWDTRTGSAVRYLDLSSPVLAVAFLGNEELLLVSRSCEVSKWDLESGESESISWLATSEGNDLALEIPKQPPTCASLLITEDGVLLALGYRNQPIFLWNALQLEVLGQCHIKSNNGIRCFAFNPNPEIPVLVVSCAHGTLHVFNYLTMELESSERGIFAQTVACSPDGRSLLTGGDDGLIQVYEFDQNSGGNIILSLIYRADSLDGSVAGVAFSLDGLRFVDVRDSQCRVWAPAALVRNDYELESTSDVLSLPPRPSAARAVDWNHAEAAEISTPFAVLAAGVFALAGRNSGKVDLFSLDSASEVGTMYQHAAPVMALALADIASGPIVVSADESGRVLVADMSDVDCHRNPGSRTPQVPGQQKQRGSAAKVVLDQRFDASVRQLLANTTADRLYVGGSKFDELWELPSGRVIARRPNPTFETNGTQTPRNALQHPTHAPWFILVAGDVAHILSWDDFAEMSSIEDRQGIHIARGILATESEVVRDSQSGRSSRMPIASSAPAAASYHEGPGGMVVEHWRPPMSGTPKLSIWLAAALDPSRDEPIAALDEPILTALAPIILKVLGFVGYSTMVFLDTNLWVCSVELTALTAAAPASSSAAGSQTGEAGLASSSRRASSTTTFQSPPSRVPSSSVSTTSLSHQRASCTAEASGSSGIAARRHFFALGEWRAGGELRCAMVPQAPQRGQSPDFAFASGDGVVVVKGGLEFCEVVTLEQQPQFRFPSYTGGALAGDDLDAFDGRGGSPENVSFTHKWRYVSGSMHRRASTR
ncbi:hypothetical protein MAPG_07579 [Magnaporthiopsis poae ATCC 64411]|uniref:GPI inositol-deacylase n=1 Tax=Magnaporthiopsis poae (strain ATCC 64411 / 73-15) TaxID=644358 RepID=A0A0C4E521_MAGP6|nr:hypothetical protein MAPG_07579 [Magnaporthiopsis poae ATCC 64411]